MSPETSDDQAPRAVSGPVHAGAPYLVGDDGPELILPDCSGGIAPSGSGHTIVVNITVAAPPTLDLQAIAAVAERAARRALH